MVDSTSQRPAGTPVAIAGQWSAQPDVTQEYVDEAALVYLNDHVFVTLGQIQVGTPLPAGEPPSTVEIRPVARLVFTEASFHKFLAMLAGVAASIPNPRAATEER